MNKKISKNDEFNHFNKIAKEWWKPYGKFKILHDILPIRMEYILKNLKNKKIKDIEILDLGCGGGLTCEALSRLGANVSGIDFVKTNIKVAKNHALKSKLNINYILGDIEKIKIKKKFDLILALEVIEHLDNLQDFIKNLKKNLKPNGIIIFSTINKNQISNFFAIYLAENILHWIPKNTHDYNKLVKPSNLKKILLKNNFNFKNLEGMNFNPISGQWKLSKKQYLINYFCRADLN